MASVKHPALLVPEIIENILLQCDRKTLLVSAQRVCRDWLATAQTPAVQKYLFFKEDMSQTVPLRNPFLSEYFPLWFPRRDVTEINFTSDHIVKLPALQPGHVEAFRHKDASWRRMLIQQPPITSFTRWVESSWMRGHSSVIYSVPDGNKVEMDPRKWPDIFQGNTKPPLLEQSPAMRMEAFYRLVYDEGHGPVSDQMFVWSGTVEWSVITKRFGYFSPEQLSALKLLLKMDGLVHLQNVVIQCTGDNPWELAPEYKL